jgi:CrcB protein
VAFVYVALGGALGSVARYAVGLVALRAAGAGFPWGTLVVNVAGSFAIGVLARYASSSTMTLLWVTGFCGGFTTYSAFNAEVVAMIERGEGARAALYVAATVALCLVVGAAGWALGRGT